MPAITTDEIRSLAEIRSDNGGVTSCYLDVDGRRFLQPRDYERILDTMLRRIRAEDHSDGVTADLERVERFVKGGFDRSGIRGVAVFACGAAGLWRVVPLPVPVRSELVVNSAPAVGQLESVLQHSERIGVLLVDKQRARCCVYALGEQVDALTAVDDLPRDYDTTGEHDRGTPAPHVAELVHQHVRHAAAMAWDLHQRHPFDHLLLGVSDAIHGPVEADLHPYLRDRLRGRIDIGPDATEAAVRTAVMAVEARIEREREAALVNGLRDAVAAGGRGVAGLDAVLDALAAHRVDRLLVSSGFHAEGWRCESCQRLAAVGRRCQCGTEMVPLADVVEEAVEEALAQSCRVEMCDANADLDVLGRIGALLRY